MTKGPDIVWEDEDTDFEDASERRRVRQLVDEEETEDFATLLDNESSRPNQSWVSPGDKVTGRVTVIGHGDDVLVDLGVKRVGVLPKDEVKDESGNLTVKAGDTIEAVVIEVRGSEVLLATKLSSSQRAKRDLETAHAEGIPVRGKVVGQNKGGFDVMIHGKKAFCPVSQIDTKFVEDKTAYIGREFDFLVEKISGRGVVVSRAALLRIEQEEKRAKILREVAENPDKVYEGTVTQVRDFGAFVDIGSGVEGLVHISELAHGRISKASDAVSIGDRVRVKVLKVEGEGDRPRISLSMKATSQDPWDSVADEFAIGTTHPGRVTRLTDFGAFVELKPGIEGLVHVSELSWEKRVRRPSDVLKPEQRVEVRILDIDFERRRLSLSMKSLEADPWRGAEERYAPGKTLYGKVESLRNFGAIIELAPGITGLLPVSTIKRALGDAYRKAVSPGLEIEVKIANLDVAQRKILLALPSLEEDEDDRQAYQAYLASEAERQEQVRRNPEGNAGLGTLGALLAEKLKGRQ